MRYSARNSVERTSGLLDFLKKVLPERIHYINAPDVGQQSATLHRDEFIEDVRQGVALHQCQSD